MATQSMIRPKHVLVATDFGDTSEAALDYGRDLARTFGAKLHVLHVAETSCVTRTIPPVPSRRRCRQISRARHRSSSNGC